jgi:hypothetical protein
LARHVPHERPDRFNIFENNNTKQQSNKEVFRRQKMEKTTHLDKGERELAKSLENEEWVFDLTKKEKNNTRNMPAIA